MCPCACMRRQDKRTASLDTAQRQGIVRALPLLSMESHVSLRVHAMAGQAHGVTGYSSKARHCTRAHSRSKAPHRMHRCGTPQLARFKHVQHRRARSSSQLARRSRARASAGHEAATGSWRAPPAPRARPWRRASASWPRASPRTTSRRPRPPAPQRAHPPPPRCPRTRQSRPGWAP